MFTELSHSPVVLKTNPKRTVLRPYFITAQAPGQAQNHIARAQHICSTVLGLSSDECEAELTELTRGFISVHPQGQAFFLERFAEVKALVGPVPAGIGDLGLPHAALIGAYFCREYAYEAAAIMNPSIVVHPDQSALADDAARFCLSVRTVGEGHLSTLSFRSVLAFDDGCVEVEPEPASAVEALPLVAASAGPVTVVRRDGTSLAEMVIFPVTTAQSNGIEDLRMVEFTEDNGNKSYLGTYTAYSGKETACESFETTDFKTIHLTPLRGLAASHKGLTFFPRRINGQYAAIGRLDLENLHYMESDNRHVWNHGELLMAPQYSWELVQMGTCGSPIELDEGWLIFLYGVGAMRRYALGAALLDKANPRTVLARLTTPLLSPQEETREGYVPNVMNSCGAIRHKDRIVIPYAVADSSIRFASVEIAALLRDMRAR
ncbi:glycoside hydrolase family 130 protein [Asticcacaulis sp. AND118]|uniref:glycoside hydrolase family 130 protein n=1 Tax=Asticcacaulis sp. AND118 TaxID=2840468 RepID=UPI001CFFC2BF|nr:glycoside hydrolase family 130 protein [Asticcacaulis sp. AND118]UDF05582.1 glycoside hydrolase family 130 protein [Asticcacaulis sp. AND118]